MNNITVLITLLVGCLVGCSDSDAQDELHRLCLSDSASPEALQACIQRGADVNAEFNPSGRPGERPLHVLVRQNRNPDAIEVLLDAGASLLSESEGGTPLHVACASNQNPEVIRLLLGAGVNRRSGMGSATPLMCAAGSNENAEVASLLLAAGADIEVASASYGRLFDRAIHYNRNPEVVATLIAAGAEVKPDALFAIFSWDPIWGLPYTRELRESRDRRDCKVIALLLEAGADVNARRDGGETSLHAAVRSGRRSHDVGPAVISALVAAGADINATDDDGNTPLHYAVRRPRSNRTNRGAVVALVDLGADVRLANNDGDTALDLAQRNNALANTDAIKALEAAANQ